MKLSDRQQKNKDLIEWVSNQSMPDDFRLFDKATSELLEICYKRYLTRFVADARTALRG